MGSVVHWHISFYSLLPLINPTQLYFFSFFYVTHARHGHGGNRYALKIKARLAHVFALVTPLFLAVEKDHHRNDIWVKVVLWWFRFIYR